MNNCFYKCLSKYLYIRRQQSFLFSFKYTFYQFNQITKKLVVKSFMSISRKFNVLKHGFAQYNQITFCNIFFVHFKKIKCTKTCFCPIQPNNMFLAQFKKRFTSSTGLKACFFFLLVVSFDVFYFLFCSVFSLTSCHSLLLTKIL